MMGSTRREACQSRRACAGQKVRAKGLGTGPGKLGSTRGAPAPQALPHPWTSMQGRAVQPPALGRAALSVAGHPGGCHASVRGLVVHAGAPFALHIYSEHPGSSSMMRRTWMRVASRYGGLAGVCAALSSRSCSASMPSSSIWIWTCCCFRLRTRRAFRAK